jgi:hypothetical protein
VEGRCPECGAPYATGIWDRSHACEYCGSLLALPDAGGAGVYVVCDRSSLTPLDVLIRYELGLLEARLSQRFQSQDGIAIEFPGWIESRLRAHERELRATAQLIQEIDFFAPYEVRDESVLQGVLGRRGHGAKLSFTQSFRVQQLYRRYDPSAYPLRDRGLKIHAFRLRLLAPEDLERVRGGCLGVVDAVVAPAIRDFARTRVHRDVQIVCSFGARWRPRALTVLKHLTYVHVRLSDREQHLLLDRQFHTVAACLEPSEAERFRNLPPLGLERLLGGARPSAMAAECPDCGAPLELDPREVIAFCAGCLRAIEVGPKALRTVPCRYPAAPAESSVYFPFWSFPFDVRSAGTRYRNLWDWLGAVSPEQRVRRLCQTDEAASRLLVPARTLLGSPALDRAAELCAEAANWSQPALSTDRPAPRPGLAALGADLRADEAASLRRFVLLALHDAQSTRGLNARNFRALIEEAVLGEAEPELALVALPLRDGALWLPEQGEGVPIELLRCALDVGRIVRSYPLD